MVDHISETKDVDKFSFLSTGILLYQLVKYQTELR